MFTRSIIWSWIISLLVSTIGVSLHAVYCYCAGVATLELFSSDHECPVGLAKRDNCCQKSIAPTPIPKNCCAVKPDRKGCMETSTKVFVLKTDLEIEKSTLLLPVPDYPLFHPVVLFSFPLLEAAILKKPDNKAPPESPPSLTGREICLRGAVFLC